MIVRRTEPPACLSRKVGLSVPDSVINARGAHFDAHVSKPMSEIKTPKTHVRQLYDTRIRVTSAATTNQMPISTRIHIPLPKRLPVRVVSDNQFPFL